MTSIMQKDLGEISYYQGEHKRDGIKFFYAGKDLGVSAWGMNVIEMKPHCQDYPEHDHKKDLQEEVYVVIKGSGTLYGEQKEWPLKVGTMIRVGPEVKRKIISGADGLTVLALGGTPGKAYVLKS